MKVDRQNNAYIRQDEIRFWSVKFRYKNLKKIQKVKFRDIPEIQE